MEINETEKKTIEKISETKAGSLKKVNKINKTFIGLTKIREDSDS